MLDIDNNERLNILRTEIVMDCKIYLYDEKGFEYYYVPDDKKRHYTCKKKLLKV